MWLVAQGLDPRYTPFASTVLGRLLLVEAGEEHVLVLDDDEGEIRPLTDPDPLIAALREAVGMSR